jgi:hypothetical protein
MINEESSNGIIDEADWVLLTSNEKFLGQNRFISHPSKRHWPSKKSVLWTDDFSNLAGLLKD